MIAPRSPWQLPSGWPFTAQCDEEQPPWHGYFQRLNRLPESSDRLRRQRKKKKTLSVEESYGSIVTYRLAHLAVCLGQRSSGCAIILVQTLQTLHPAEWRRQPEVEARNDFTGRLMRARPRRRICFEKPTTVRPAWCTFSVAHAGAREHRVCSCIALHVPERVLGLVIIGLLSF